MKARILVLGFLIAAATPARAGSVSYAQCGTYDSYLWIYRTTEKFEELGKLRCEEKVEVLTHWEGYAQIRTLDGRVGWVHDADLAETPPPPQKSLTFGLTELPRPVPASVPSKRSGPFLTNEDVLTMYRERSSLDLIVKKIKSTRCDFDTSPATLLQLKAAGLSDVVILAMLASPVASETAEEKTSETVEVTIPDGTPVEVELNGSVWAEGVREGMIVQMLAAEDVVVNGVPVIVKGAQAHARVMAVRQPGARGGSGEVAWFMQDVVAISGDHIPAIFATKQPGNNRPRSFEGYPFFSTEFHEGSQAIKSEKKHFRAVIHGDMVVNVSQSLAAGLSAAKLKSQPVQASPQPTVQPTAARSPQPSAPDEAKP